MALPNRVLRVIRIWHQENKRTWRSQFQNLIDARAIEKLRARYKAENGQSLPYPAIIAQAVGRALSELKVAHPELNAYLRRTLFGLRPHYFEKISFGCTFALENQEGYEQVIIAVIEEPEKKSLKQISGELEERFNPEHKTVRESALYYRLPGFLQKILAFYGENSRKARYLYRGTVSYTSLGKFGVDIHDLPTSATLTFGMGQVKERALTDKGQVIAAPSFYFFMCIDRRLMNGHAPAILLSRISQILENADVE